MTTTEPFLERLQQLEPLLGESSLKWLLNDMEEAFTQSTYVRVEDVVGIKEIAEFFSVGRSTVSQWASRRKTNGMPKPFRTIGGGTLYDLTAVVEWWIGWKPSKGAKTGTLPEGAQ